MARNWLPQGIQARSDSGGDEDNPRLKLPSRKLPPWLNIGLRLGVAVGALIITAAVVYFERDCYDDNGVLGDITWIDAFYYATVSLSTTGYGDIAPVCESARLVNVIVITPLRFIFLIVLIGTTVEVLTKKTRDELRRNNWRKSMRDHTVIIGFGVKGRSAARMLMENGVPAEKIVVVAKEQHAISDATRMGLAGVLGDGRRDDVLEDAAVGKAKQVIVATNEDDTSVLVTLTVRRLNKTADIVAAVRESSNAEILRQSGADNVIPTAESAGNLMALSLVSPEAGDLMEDLLDSGRGLEIVQRPITKEELGLSPTEIDATGQIVMVIIRNGVASRFNNTNIRILEKGDELVVIRESEELRDRETNGRAQGLRSTESRSTESRSTET